jgi:Telomere length regulation protein
MWSSETIPRRRLKSLCASGKLVAPVRGECMRYAGEVESMLSSQNLGRWALSVAEDEWCPLVCSTLTECSGAALLFTLASFGRILSDYADARSHCSQSANNVERAEIECAQKIVVECWLQVDTCARLSLAFDALFDHFLDDPIVGRANSPLFNNLVSLSERVASLLGGDGDRLPHRLRPKVHIAMLCSALARSLSSASRRCERAAALVGDVLSRCVRLGHIDAVAASGGASSRWRDEASVLVARRLVRVGARGDAFLYDLLARGQVDDVAALLGDALALDRVQHALANAFVCANPLPSVAALRRLVDVLHGAELLRDACSFAACVWSDADFVHPTGSEARHDYLTRFIAIALPMLGAECIDNDASIGSTLLGGVSVHLHSNLPHVRQLGMLVAEQYAQLLDPSNPSALRFDELQDSYRFDFLQDQDEHDEVVVDKDSEDDAAAQERVGDASSLDPDELWTPTIEASSWTSDDDNDGNDDAFEAYALPDDEVIRAKQDEQVEKPIYLRDCLEALRDRESCARVHGALDAVCELVESRPADLKDMGAELLLQLLRMENRFDKADFEELRNDALVAVLVHGEHPSIVKLATKQLYESSYSIRQRIDVLDALIGAAEQLSSSSSSPPPPPLVSPHDNRSDLGRVTRRSARRASAVPAERNRFAPLVAHFALPIMAKFDDPSNSFNLMGRDTVVIAKLIYALGTFIECAGQSSPIIDRMVSAAINFVLAVRYHSDAFVRRSALFTAFRAIAVFPPSTLLQVTTRSDLVELQRWLHDTRDNDRDPDCQELARALCAYPIFDAPLPREASSSSSSSSSSPLSLNRWLIN